MQANRMEKMATWALPIEEAAKALLECARQGEVRRVPVEDACDRVLAEDIIAGEMLPPFTRAAHDGYALRAEDTRIATERRPVTLRIVEKIHAGHTSRRALASGEAARIMTGGPIPSGANAVIPWEETAFDAHFVSMFAPVKPRAGITPAGKDIARGDLAAKAGTVLTPAHIGLLAGIGVAEVPVYRRLTVAIISTGDELLPAGEPLSPGKIHNSSYYALRAYLEAEGMRVLPYAQARDSARAIGKAISAALLAADVVLTTGGVSVGDYDVVHAAVANLGGRLLFSRVAMKPGGAMLGAVVDGRAVLALSGGPAASALGLFLVGMPYIRRCAGQTAIWPETMEVALAKPCPENAGTSPRIVPGSLAIREGRAFLLNSPVQGKAMASALLGCEVAGEIPAGAKPLPKGTVIRAYRLSGGRRE